MQWILNAILRYQNLLLYLFLLFISLLYSSVKSEFHQNRLSKASLFISGTLYQPFVVLTDYTRLSKHNQDLLTENNSLKNLVLAQFNRAEIDALEEENIAGPQYVSVPAKIIKNSFNKNRNVLLINKGEKEGIGTEMGVIGPTGIIGIINKTSNNYASVLSLLNTDLKINAKFKSSQVFGSLHWSGKAPNHMLLEDVSVVNPVAVGDTLVTGGMSAYFPEGIPIGTVLMVEQPENGGYYEIEVELINNMTNLNYVYVIENKDREEIVELLAQ